MSDVEAIYLLVERSNVSVSPSPGLPPSSTLAYRYEAQPDEDVSAVMDRIAAEHGAEWIGCTLIGVDAADVVTRVVNARLDAP